MSGPDPAVAAVRLAVRRLLAAERPAGVLVACSGGPDSVALAAATAFEAPKLGMPAGLVTVDHALQARSAERAAAVAGLGRQLGLDPVLVHPVRVGTAGGREAAARTARYGGLRARLPAGWAVLLGHTLDDQAETVLLGLGRGSGPRSIAGMRPVDGAWLRPLLGVRRAGTRAACAAQGLPVWDDPHNDDARFTRARLRSEVLPLLEDVLAGGVAEALARTAELLREDLDTLDYLTATIAAEVLAPVEAGPATVDAVALAAYPVAIRTRVLRGWLRTAGAAPTSAQLRALDALVADWHGQGEVALPSKLGVVRASGKLHLARRQR